jgi:hypothetical protein
MFSGPMPINSRAFDETELAVKSAAHRYVTQGINAASNISSVTIGAPRPLFGREITGISGSIVSRPKPMFDLYQAAFIHL